MVSDPDWTTTFDNTHAVLLIDLTPTGYAFEALDRVSSDRDFDTLQTLGRGSETRANPDFSFVDSNFDDYGSGRCR